MGKLNANKNNLSFQSNFHFRQWRVTNCWLHYRTVPTFTGWSLWTQIHKMAGAIQNVLFYLNKKCLQWTYTNQITKYHNQIIASTKTEGCNVPRHSEVACIATVKCDSQYKCGSELNWLNVGVHLCMCITRKCEGATYVWQCEVRLLNGIGKA